jgi:putative membrane protein
MKRLTISVLMLASAGLAVAGCSKSNDDASTADATSAATDAAAATPTSQAIADSHTSQFLTEAMQGDNSEVKLGQLAADQGSAKGVRDFGKMLVDDHGAHKQQLTTLATSMGVAVSDDATPEANLEYDKLMGMKGADFDKEFVGYMVNDHQKDIDKYKQEAGSKDPQPVIDMVNQTLPTLQKHLDTAKSLQKG